MNTVSNLMEVENKMHIAYTGGMRTISHIIPYLEQRQMAAKRYFESSGMLTADERKNYIELVECLNNDIKKIMGL